MAASVLHAMSPRPRGVQVAPNEREQRICDRVGAMTESELNAQLLGLTLCDRRVLVASLMFDEEGVY